MLFVRPGAKLLKLIILNDVLFLNYVKKIFLNSFNFDTIIPDIKIMSILIIINKRKRKNSYR